MRREIGLALVLTLTTLSSGCFASHGDDDETAPDRDDAGTGEPPPDGLGLFCRVLFDPEDGFHPREVYIEAPTSRCVSTVCMVYGLEGDASTGCTDGCASADEVERRMFCTCRCSAAAGMDTCACPSGFRCEELIRTSTPDRNGGYCVRDDLPSL